MTTQAETSLKEMKIRIEKIEQLALELAELGGAAPAVRKNCQALLSATYNLRFGICDVAEISNA